MAAIKLINDGIFYADNSKIVDPSDNGYAELSRNKEFYKTQTIAYKILENHNIDKSDESKMKIKFDCLASHDITYVGIIQTARASGIDKFPVPYVLTNCHNSLGAVGGTINEDDHVFGLSAARKYGGIFVPAHLAVIHTYMREMMSGCGKMILGSDSHTRYGALGTMAFGEGGPEIVKQLLGRTYDFTPEVIAVYLTGNIKKGVGPQDVALKIIGEVFKNGFVKNKILEFIGDGIKNLPIEFRNGIDVMTTEAGGLSSVWITDGETKKYYETHGRKEDYKELKPGNTAYYDGAIIVDLSKIECMIAMPFHPSNTYEINEVNQNLEDILNLVGRDAPGAPICLQDKIINGRFKVDQGIIAGCAGGTFDNICASADILRNKNTGNGEFSLSVYPGSQPINLEITKNGVAAELLKSGVIMRSAFCGPCFGADCAPANNGFSIRHSTRNFPNREGSKPNNNQTASVALMDARSIAATAANGGYLTAATDTDVEYNNYKFNFDGAIYKNRVYFGYENAQTNLELKFGPNIADWPAFESLNENIILKVCSVITDEVTTTDELIPSGETSSYRSNPYKLAEFTLSRKDPMYFERAKSVGRGFPDAPLLLEKFSVDLNKTSIGSVIFANKPGDGSAREQAASCQKVLGGMANIAREYATKRYRSNLINWGMIPFIYDGEDLPFENGDYISIPRIKDAIKNKEQSVKAYICRGEQCSPAEIREITLQLPELTDDERDIILAGCLINYYRDKK